MHLRLSVLFLIFSQLVQCTGTLSETERTRYLNTAFPSDSSERAGTLGPDDVFEVRVYEQVGLSGDFRVAPDGSVDFPLVGTIRVSGLRQDEVAALLRTRLQDGFLKEPFVTVYIKEYNSKKIFVVGMVEDPGTFVFQEGMNIVQAVTLAGGFRNTAVKNETIVTRVVEGKEMRVTVPVEEISAGRVRNFLLSPGDIVFVPESVL